MRPMSTYAMTITIKPNDLTSTPVLWEGEGMVWYLNPLLPITVNTFYIIVEWRVADILIPTSTSFTMTPTVTSFIFMNTIIHVPIRTRYMQQYSMVACVMVVIVAGMGPISASPIITNSFPHIERVKLADLFIPRPMYDIIKSYIPPQVTC